MTEAEKMELLRKLVAFRSVNGHELPVAQYIQSLFEAEGIESQVLPFGDDRANLVATIGSGEPVLAISGHMDVVDVNMNIGTPTPSYSRRRKMATPTTGAVLPI